MKNNGQIAIGFTAGFLVSIAISFLLVGNAKASEKYDQCIGCHGAAGEGGVGPQLVGQTKEQIARKLTLYRQGSEVGPMSAMMWPMASGLTDDDIIELSKHISGLK